MSGIGPITPGVTSAVQTYLAGTYTWTKPAWAKFVRVLIIGGGGAGASGRRGAASSARCGGAGGGGGGISEQQFLASELPATVTVYVHGNCPGGAANVVDDTDGTLGTVQAQSYFGPNVTGVYLTAFSGNRGQVGTAAATSNGGNVGIGGVLGDVGATGTTSAGTAKAATGNSAPLQTRGGGGGGGMLAGGDVESVGGTGQWPTQSYTRTAPANGGAVHAAGGPGVASGFIGQPGASGGGGGSGHAAAGGAGGDGTAIGAGGGGGGASTNGQVAGKGGDGGPSVIIVTSVG